jgi:hypothetical protein
MVRTAFVYREINLAVKLVVTYFTDLAAVAQNYLYFLRFVVYHVSKVYFGAVNTTVDYKPALKCLIYWLFYFHPTTCFDLSRSSSGGSILIIQ